MHIFKPYYLLFLLVFWANSAFAQDIGQSMYPVVVVDGDTMAHVRVEPVVKTARRRFRSKADMRRYYRMIRNLKKTYPYAQMAKVELRELNEKLKGIESSRDRKRLIKETEKSLFSKYEKDLRKFSISQGKMLIKLIDRETGQTSYLLVRELKGGFSATFWQGIARLFGSSLKLDYDPKGEDKILEELIILYEEGLL